MSLRNKLALLSICLLTFVGWSQTVSFTTFPEFQGNAITICEGMVLSFTDDSQNLPPNTTLNWTFPGGTPASATGGGPHNINYATAGAYVATLTAGGQSFSLDIDVQVGAIPNVALGIGSSFTQGFYNNIPYYLSCDGTALSFLSISTNSQNTDANTVHTINWGNGEPDFVYTGANFIFNPATTNSSSFYSEGEYTMTYTVDNGQCAFVQTQQIYAGIPPGGSIENVLQAQSFCIPGSVEYSINPQANGAGTSYIIEFNDGNGTTYNYQHPPPATILHEFPINSCGSISTFDGTTYYNSFSVTMTTSNPCGQATSGIAPIIISDIPEADYLMSDTIVCVNEPVIFTNASFNGSNITGGVNAATAGCDTLADVIWTHDPIANVNLINGDLGTLFVTPIGTQWFPGTEEIQLSFSEPGQYQITLYVRNKPLCGLDSITKTICVIPELIADFSLDDSSACAPYIFEPENLSNFVNCDINNVFEWTITRTNPQNCPYGTNPGYTFLNGTSANSVEPEIEFTAPGVYEIQLINSLEVFVPGNLCQGDTIVKTLIIKDIPFIDIDPLVMCEGSSYTLAPPLSECYADNGATYFWDFSPSSASIPNSTDPAPSVSYSGTGNYNYSVTVTNECGAVNDSAPVTVEQGIEITLTVPSSNCLNSPLPVSGVITGAVTTGTWSSDLPGSVFLPSPSSLSTNFDFPNGYIGPVTLTLTSDSSSNGCPPASESVVLLIDNTIFADAGDYDPICINSSINLNGSFGGLATSASWSTLGGGTFADVDDLNTTFTPPVNFTGTIDIVLTTDDPLGDCVADADTVTIVVSPLPNIVALPDTTVCFGNPVTTQATGGSTYDWDQGLGLGASHVVTPSSTTTYTVTGTDSIGCVNTAGLTITVLPAPTMDPVSDMVLCDGETSSEVIFNSTFANTIFNWTRTPASIGTIPNFGSGNLLPFDAENQTNNLLSSTVTVTPEAANCQGAPQTFTITVHPVSTITNSLSQTLCPGVTQEVVWTNLLDPTLVPEYSWEISAIGPDLSGALLSGTGNIPSMTIINTGLTTQEVEYTINHHVDSCFGTPVTYTFIINPGPVIDPIPDQVVCSGDAFSSVNPSSSVPNTVINWTLTNTNIPTDVLGYPQPNGPGGFAGTVVTNTGLNPYTLIYEFTASALGCTGAPEIFELTVNSTLSAFTDIPDQSICNNSSSTEVQISANVPGSDLTWEVINSPAFLSGLNVTDGSNVIPAFSFSNSSFDQIATVEIAIIATNVNLLSCPSDTVFYEISVLPSPNADPIADAVYCDNAQTNDVIFSGSASNFAWEHNGTGILLPNSGNNDILSFVIENNSANQETITFSVVPQVSLNNFICEGDTMYFDWTVYPSGEMDSIPNIAVCLGDVVPQVDFVSPPNDGTTSYTWTADNLSIGLNQSGNSSFTPTFIGLNPPPATTVNIGVISVTPIYNNNGVSCPGEIEQFEIAVNPLPQIITIADTFICNAQILDFAPQTNIPSDYSWFGNQNTQVNGISMQSQTTSSINDSLINISPDPQPVNYTITPVISGTGCAGDTNYVQVVVEPHIFMTSPTVYEICSGTSVNSILTSNIPANYTWFATPNPNIAGSSNFSVSSNIIDDVLYNTDNTPHMVVYTVIPTTLSGNCQGDPLIVNVLVNPELQVQGPNEFTICNNTITNIPLIANATGTFSWFASPSPGVLGETTSIQNSTSIENLLLNNSDTIQEVIYNVVVTSQDQGCTSQNFPITVKVIPDPEVIAPSDLTICELSSNPEITPEGTFTNLNWTNNNINTGIAEFSNFTPVFQSFTAQNDDNFPIVSDIQLTPIYEFGGLACFGNPTGFEITVNPAGQVNFIPNIEVCHNTSVPITPISTSNQTGLTTFSWTNDNLQIGLNLTSGSGVVPAFTSTNTFSGAPISSTITVTGNYVHNGVACPSPPTTFEIIVNPIPTLDPIPNQVHCANDLVPLYNFLGTGVNHFIWSHNNTSIGLPNNGFGNLPEFTASNPTFNSIQSIMEVTPYYLSTISSLICEGSPQDFTISVQPSPFVSFQTDDSIYCSRNDVTFFNYSGPNVSFSWDFGDGATSTVVNPLHEYDGPGTYTVTLTGISNATGCVGTYSENLTILETPIVNFSVDSAWQCDPAIFTFTDLVQTPFTNATWFFGDGSFTVQNDSVPHVYLEYGCYDVGLLVTHENGCKDSLTIEEMVCFLPAPIAYFTTDALEYSTTDPLVTFINESQFAESYFWDFGDSTTATAINPIHFYPEYEAGYGITLTAMNEIGCTDQYGLYITILEDELFYVPNTFTPDETNSLNKVFLPIITSGFEMDTYYMVVYNRWGEMVYETTDINAGWDGTFGGQGAKECPDGTYTWKIILRGILDDEATEYYGHVNLLR